MKQTEFWKKITVNNLKSNGNMAVNKVDLYVSQILEDLNSGLTWLKKDDLGYGSVEAKYGANEKQIFAIRKHPSLKDAETNITIFNVIDDLKNGTDNSKESLSTGSNAVLEQNMERVERRNTDVATDLSNADVQEDLNEFLKV